MMRLMIWKAHNRMDTKVHLAYMTFFIFLILKVSKAETPTPPDLTTVDMTSIMARSATLTPAPHPTGRRVTREANPSSDTSSPKLNAGQNITANKPVSNSSTTAATKAPTAPKMPSTPKAKPTTTTRASTVASSLATPKNTTKNATAWPYDPEWEKDFTYDYHSLRVAGLSIAGVLFFLGIMVISCGKVKCHKCSVGSKKKSYQLGKA